MAAFARQREISAIAALLVLNGYFGISDKTTKFTFPAFGQEVFSIINFYTAMLAIVGVAFGLTILYRFLNNKPLNLPTIPSAWAVILNYLIFIAVAYIAVSWLVTGNYGTVPVPQVKNIVEQGIIAADENLLSFIFLATIFPFGTGVGDAKLPKFSGFPQLPWTIFTIRDYSLRFNPPNLNRLKYGLYAIALITLLHSGAYSYQVSTFNEFYIAMIINFILFYILFFIKESFGFGSCIAGHHAWNLVLITVRGSVY